MKVLIILLLLLAPGAAMASGLDGKYRMNEQWDCKSIGMDGGAIAINGNIFTGVESSCKMKNPVKLRDMNATLYDLECGGEGENWTTRAMFMRHDEGLIIIWPGTTGTIWQRCPR